MLRRGVQLRREHRNDEALDTFRRAVALSATPTARAQLALAEQAVGRWVDADRDLQAALLAEADPWVDRNRASLEGAGAEIARHLAWLVVEANVPGAAARLDDQRFDLATAMRVLAGAHVLDVRADGYSVDVRRVDLAPEEHVRVSVTLRALEAPPGTASVTPAPVTPAPVPTHPRLAPTFPLATAPSVRSPFVLSPGAVAFGVVGIAAIAVGTYFGVRTFDEKAARNALCSSSCKQSVLPAADDYDEQARRSADISTLSFGVAAAAIAAGVTFWLIDRSAHAHAASVALLPVVGPTSGIVVRMSAP